MPQLNPFPWFFILFSSWLIFLIFSTMKISKYMFLNDPTNLTFKNANKSWTWPWS
uniref:ATP synthase complex subunit 8 n=1 Tax=Allobates sp. Neblina TaxID=2772347 RepID=A0A7M4CGB1_9NEOB|nr:ATP synthase F0 subunit 8 [Allobates sp. Neblina]